MIEQRSRARGWHASRRPLRPAAMAGLLIGVLAMVGCRGGPKGTPVTFAADPGSATLRVERLANPEATRGQLVAQGPSPLSTRLELSAPQANYRITAEPLSQEARESYRTTAVVYDRDSLMEASGAAGGGSSGLRVTLPLREQDSLPMFALLPVYHPRDGWLAVRTRLRSYQSLVEADGTAPEQVAPLSALSAVGGAQNLGNTIGVWGLDVSSADGGRLVTAVFEPGEDGLVLSPDDPEVAPRIARMEPEQRRNARVSSGFRFPITSSDLVSLRLTGLTEVRLTSDGHVDLTPAFSPDGQYVLFASTRDQRDQSDIFRRPALRAGALDVVTRNLPDGGAAWPSQASDGTVSFGFFPTNATGPDGGHLYAKIGGLGGYDSLIVQGGSDPRISPDGRSLAYVSGGNLWVCSVDGSQQRQLTTDAAAILQTFGERSLSNDEDRRRFEQFEKQWLFRAYRDPAWSPDGRRLAYSSMAGVDGEGRPNYDIWLLDLETGQRTQLTSNGSADVLPRFDPAGRQVYFISNRGKQWAVWRLPVPESSAE